jgi:hypothetical protein
MDSYFTHNKGQSFQRVIMNISSGVLCILKEKFRIGNDFIPYEEQSHKTGDVSGSLAPDEQTFLEAVINAPFWLTHYTKERGEIERSGYLFSLDEFNRLNRICHTPGASECTDRSIQRILSKVQMPDYIIACENPLRIIFASKIYPQGVDPERHDWFAELGLVRKRA